VMVMVMMTMEIAIIRMMLIYLVRVHYDLADVRERQLCHIVHLIHLGCVTEVSQRRKEYLTEVLQRLLQERYRRVTEDITGVLQRSYEGDAKVSQRCYRSVQMMLMVERTVRVTRNTKF
jgi:hypothetical protein